MQPAFCSSTCLSASPPFPVEVAPPRPPCLPHQEILWTSVAHRSWGSSCVYYYTICMTLLQLQVVPEDTNQTCCHNTPLLKVNWAFSTQRRWQPTHAQPWPEQWRKRESAQTSSLFYVGKQERIHLSISKCFIRRCMKHGLIFSPHKVND